MLVPNSMRLAKHWTQLISARRWMYRLMSMFLKYPIEKLYFASLAHDSSQTNFEMHYYFQSLRIE
jgi:hypothetical protein